MTRWTALALGLTLALGAAACDGKPEAATSTSPPASPSASPKAPTDRQVALAFMRAQWSGGYRDKDAGAWLPRVRKYVSPALYARLRRLHSGATGSGVAWMDIKKYKLVPRFRPAGTKIVEKQPSGPDTHFVRVAYSVRYTTVDGRRPPESVRLSTDLPATKRVLRLDRGAAGWRVSDDYVGDGSGVGG